MSIQLQIETTSVCNARCHFCVYPTTERKRTFMPIGLYEKIVSEAATIPQFIEVQLTGLGEPLLDPHLDRRVRTARNLFPHTPVCIYTNGTYLTPSRFERLKLAGLSHLNISLNAISAEQRKKVMGLDDWDAVFANVQHAMANRNGISVTLRAVVDGETFTRDDVNVLRQLYGDARLSDDGRVICVREGNWSGEFAATRDFTPNEACGRALGQFYVTVEGIVTACCFDPVGKLTFGDLKKQTIREVYASEKYAAFRLAHSENRADEYDICRVCTRI